MKERIIKAIFSAVDEINEHLPPEQRVEKTLEFALFGRTGNLDSLGLVTMIVAVEQRVEEEFAVKLTLADENMMSQKQDPFKTIGTLADHISILLANKKNEQR